MDKVTAGAGPRPRPIFKRMAGFAHNVVCPPSPPPSSSPAKYAKRQISANEIRHGAFVVSAAAVYKEEQISKAKRSTPRVKSNERAYHHIAIRTEESDLLDT